MQHKASRCAFNRNMSKQPDFSKGLVPAIIQDASTRTVLMLGYMNEEAYAKTVSEQRVTFFSRSKNPSLDQRRRIRQLPRRHQPFDRLRCRHHFNSGQTSRPHLPHRSRHLFQRVKRRQRRLARSIKTRHKKPQNCSRIVVLHRFPFSIRHPQSRPKSRRRSRRTRHRSLNAK